MDSSRAVRLIHSDDHPPQGATFLKTPHRLGDLTQCEGLVNDREIFLASMAL